MVSVNKSHDVLPTEALNKKIVTKSCFAIAKTVKQACGSRIFFAVQ
jgi:hypothetical protein